MKRRRSLAAGAAACLLPLIAACGGRGDPQASESTPPGTPGSASASEPTPQTPTPTESSSSSSAPSGDVVRVSLTGLEDGAPPSVDYLKYAKPQGWQLVRPEGPPVKMPHPYYMFAPAGDHTVGLRIGDRSVVDVLDAQGAVTHSEPATGYQLAVTQDGSLVGWLRPNGTPADYDPGDDEVLTGPPVEQGADLSALAGTDTCREAESPVHGCLWFVTDEQSQRTWSASSHGIVEEVPGVDTVADADDRGYVLGISSVSDDGSCSVLKKTFGAKQWETCDVRLREFSPDARRISATNAYGDGQGDTQLAILDRDGTVEKEFLATRGVTFMVSSWEDANHLLVLTYAEDSWSVLRFGVDGSVEVAVPAIAGNNYQTPLVLQQR